MKKHLSSSVSILFILLCAATAARADVRIRQKNTIAGRSSESVIAIKGPRFRQEVDMGTGSKIINLSQCDLKRTVTINEATRRYTVTPTTAGPASGAPMPGAGMGPVGPQPGAERRQGGVITFTQTLTDTGERKQMFGFQARRIKTATQITSDANACSPINRREETDGWYIDLEFTYGCPADAGPSAPPETLSTSGCQDRVVRKQIGRAKLGYPVMFTQTTYGEDGAVQFQYATEVVELTRTALDQALFEVPAGYTEAASAQELYAISMGDGGGDNPGAGAGTGGAATVSAARDAVLPKQAGVLRVGVVQIINRAQREVSTQPLQSQLVSAISGANVDAVALISTEPDAIEAEAVQKACDFILYTDVTDLKVSAAKKLGGLFGKAAGIGSGGLDKTEARIEFRLMSVSDNAVPRLQSSANGKGDGDSGGVSDALKKEAKAVVGEVSKKK
jgi:hypothetical protein